jgi:hypothetical protein
MELEFATVDAGRELAHARPGATYHRTAAGDVDVAVATLQFGAAGPLSPRR